MASRKAIITENVQKYLEKSDWKAAIREMEKLFSIDQDPLVRVRIGDARLKLNRKHEAIRDYVRAGDLFAEKGFVIKALAQYNLALRLDSSNNDARTKVNKIRLLRTFNSNTKPQRESMEYRMPPPIEGIVNSMPDPDIFTKGLTTQDCSKGNDALARAGPPHSSLCPTHHHSTI